MQKQTVIDINSKIKDAENFIMEGDLERATSVYEELINYQPDNAFIYNQRGQLKAKSNEWLEAIDSYQKSLNLGIDCPFWTYKNLGDALKETNRLDEAILNYQKAINIQSDNPEVYDSLGQVQSLQGFFEQAIASYQQALKLDINNPFWTYMNLADALFEENRLDEAKSAYQKARQLQPNNPLLIERLEEIEQQLPNKTPHNNWLEIHERGDEYFKQEKWSEAIALYKQAIALNPNYVWSYCNISRALAKLQIFDELQYYCTLAIEMNSNHSEIYGYIGDIFAEQKQWNLADYYYRQAISIDKENLPLSIFQNYSEVLEAKKCQQHNVLNKQEKLNDKLIEHHRLIAEEPENCSLYKAMADDLVELGETQKAIVCYKIAMQLDPNDTTILESLNAIIPVEDN